MYGDVHFLELWLPFCHVYKYWLLCCIPETNNNVVCHLYLNKKYSYLLVALNKRLTEIVLFFFPNSHFVRSFIKKGLVPGSGLSSLTENDETATFSQIDLNQLTKAMSQVTMLLLLVAQFLTMKVFFPLNLWNILYTNAFEHNK